MRFARLEENSENRLQMPTMPSSNASSNTSAEQGIAATGCVEGQTTQPIQAQQQPQTQNTVPGKTGAMVVRRIFTSRNSEWDFVYLLEGHYDLDGKYSVRLSFLKTDPAALEIQAAIMEVINDGKKLYGAKFTPQNKILKDGDVDDPKHPEFAGKYFLKARSKWAPEIIEYGTKRLLKDAQSVHQGCVGPACIELKPWVVGGKMLISCTLVSLMKMGEVDRRPRAVDVFANYHV